MTRLLKYLGRPLNIARVFLSVYYAYMVEYRAELLFWVLSGSLPLILMGVWSQAAAGGNFGLSPLDVIRYFLAVFFVRQFTVVWVIWDFEREVVEGRLSPKLLQPIDPVWHHFGRHVAERFARFPFIILVMAIAFLIYPEAMWVPNIWHGLLTIGVIFLAFVLRFLIQYTLAMLAFWTERASALDNFWTLLYLFLSGMIAPLEVFPQGLRDILVWLPFPYFIHFPASLLIGWSTNIPRSLLVMGLWGIILFWINRWLWQRGLRRYSGMGA